MDANANNNDALVARIEQLEHERDELRKDIEQLCMQQAGPGYLAVATRMHFQRTAGLEQEIENLRKKLAVCSRENVNLQEELSEAYRIKGQLADLHHAEAAKNMEAEKQVKFFQGCVAAAFSERDHSIMEAEKAKEKEELMSQKLNEIQIRLEELTSDLSKHKRLNDALQIDLAQEKYQNEMLKKVVDKFYGIRMHCLERFVDTSWDDKCACLLHDAAEIWSCNDTSTSNYISALEGELEKVRSTVDKLQSKLRVGLEIENHLQRKVVDLEKKLILAHKIISDGIAELQHQHSQHRVHIMNLLNDGRSHIKSVTDVVKEKIKEFHASIAQTSEPFQKCISPVEDECRDVYLSIDAEASLAFERNDNDTPDTAHREGNASDALAQALQEKVAALLLLSQQEERHLLDRNVNAAIQEKIEELQRNLLQVTNEKVKALMELAQLKQDYRQLQESIRREVKQGHSMAKSWERRSNDERDGKLRNLLKKSYLRRWIGTVDSTGNESEAHPDTEGNFPGGRFNNIDFARMKIENATLKESMDCMEHLTSSIHRLRLALLKVKGSVTSEDKTSGMWEALDDIISEAKLVKTALGSSLPVSWSANVDASVAESNTDDPTDYSDNTSRKIDSVSAAGFEMVELLMLAAQMLKENEAEKVC